MGLNRWWNDDSDKANDFLRTGAYNDVVRNAPLNFDKSSGSGGGSSSGSIGPGGCTSSSQCPAGYACVSGRCTLMGTGPTGGTSNGQVNNAGACDQDDPNSSCNSGGPTSCSQTPNCGDVPSPGAGDCCGERCCSYGSASSQRPGIHCYCGKCPDPTGKRCSIFCDGYSAANGESVMGCNEGNSCGDCDECDLFSKQCDRAPAGSAPCWCEESQCEDCFNCNSDPESDGFGQCEVSAPGACSVCSHISEYKCPCGETVGPITACSKYGPGGSGYGGNVILTSKSALEIAKERCAPESSCDPCAGECEGKTYPSDNVPPCPPGIKCVGGGTISGGGQSYTIRTECDMSNVPESCKQCDCNCHNDCPDCQLCGADGLCYDDPLCADARGPIKAEWASIFTYENRYFCFGDQEPQPDTCGAADRLYSRTLTQDGEIVLIQQDDRMTQRVYAGTGCDCPGVADGVQKNQIVITYRDYATDPEIGEQLRFEQGGWDGQVVCGPQWGNDYRENYSVDILVKVTVGEEVVYEREQPPCDVFYGTYALYGPPGLE